MDIFRIRFNLDTIPRRAILFLFSGFGVIRVNDEESNELLFLVRYDAGLIRRTLHERRGASRQHDNQQT